MKLLALCVICGFLATGSFARTDIEKDGDESSDYGDLFGDAVKGVQEFLGNALDDSDSNESDDSEGKVGSGALNGDNESSDEVEEILNVVDSLFGGTIRKLQTIGETALDEFMQSLRDLIEAFIESEDKEENDGQALGSEAQQSNSQNLEENSNNSEQHKNEQAATAEKHSNGNNVPVEKHEKPETVNSLQDNKPKDNNENNTSEKAPQNGNSLVNNS